MRRRVLVIGSGLAGTLLANTLARDHEVTVLEAGRANGYDHPPVKYLKKEFGQVKTFCHGEGGTTNLWHNGLIPMRPEDMQHVAFREALREAAPYADAAAERLYFPGSRFSAEHQNLNRRMGALNDRLGLFGDGVDCLIYPKRYRGLRVSAGVRTHFRVSDIGFEVKGRTVNQIHFTSENLRHRIDTDLVVISAGALGTPSLVNRALASLGHTASQAGPGLMDHPMGFVGKIRVGKDTARALRELSLLDCGAYECCTAGRLKCRSYLAAVYFRPALTMANRLSLYKYKSLLGASRGAARVRAALSPRLLHPDVLAEIYAHLFHATIQSNVFSVLVFFEQKRGAGFVTADTDRLTVSWEISLHELDIYNEMLKRLAELLGPLADDLTIAGPIDDSWLWSGAHHSGTISMGDGEDDIVGPDLRVRMSDNLYVCDASIIQEHSYANTGLTIGQLALRLAATIQ